MPDHAANCRLYCCAMVLTGALIPLPALAGAGAALTPEAGISWLHDDNVLRAQDGNAAADTSRRLAAGIVLDATVGTQVVTGAARLANVAFDRLHQLDHDAREAQGAWQWRLGSHVTGSLAASYSQVLAPYGDIASSQRNLRVQQGRRAEGAWLFHPRWQVRAGIGRDTYAFELPALQASARRDRTIDTGIDYLAPGGSTIGLQLREVQRDYATAPSVNGALPDNDNIQRDARLKVDWHVSAITYVQFVGGWARRTQPLSPQRDAHGPKGRLIADWSPLAPLRFNAALWREFGAIDSSVLTSSENRGVSIGTTWQPRSKVQVNLQWRREARSFAAAQDGAASTGLDDVTRAALLAAVFAPRAGIQLSVSAGRDSRSSGTAAGLYGLKRYRSQSAAFNAIIRF